MTIYLRSEVPEALTFGQLDGNFAALRQLQLACANFVTPQQYGASGDGSTDDTAAFSAAINTGLPVVVPAVLYVLGSVLGKALSGDRNIVMRGFGKATRIICRGGYGMFFNTANCNNNYGAVHISDMDIVTDQAGTCDWALKVISGPRTTVDEGKAKIYIQNVSVYGTTESAYFDTGMVFDGGPLFLDNVCVRGSRTDYRLCTMGIYVSKGIQIVMNAPQVFFCKDGIVIGEGTSGTSVEGTTIKFGHIVICERGVVVRTGAPGDLHIIEGNHINTLSKGVYVDDASTDLVSFVHVKDNTIYKQTPRIYGDGLFSIDTGTAQAGGSTTITLATTATLAEEYYVGKMVYISAGTGSGQIRQITAFNTTTKVATVDTAWGTNPDNTSVYYVEFLFSGIEGVFKYGLISGNTTTRNYSTYDYGIRLLTGSVDCSVIGNISEATTRDVVIEDSDASGHTVGLNHSISDVSINGMQSTSVAGANTGARTVSQAGKAIIQTVSRVSNANLQLKASGTGVIDMDNPVKHKSYTVATLPAAATAGAGARAYVTDSSVTTFLSTVAGGGSSKIPVHSDGTNWLVG